MPLDEDFIDKLNKCLEVFPERELVLRWLVDEWYHYANNKFYSSPTDVHLQYMKDAGWKDPPKGFWARQVFQYQVRAKIFGVGEEGSQASKRGKQAALKMSTTLLDGLATMAKVFGDLPEPGVPSGEIRVWTPS